MNHTGTSTKQGTDCGTGNRYKMTLHCKPGPSSGNRPHVTFRPTHVRVKKGMGTIHTLTVCNTVILRNCNVEALRRIVNSENK